MKFIHLTDTHLIGDGLLYGHDPFERLENAIGSINAEHKDAEFAVVTGDMIHWGSADAYKQFAKAIAKLDMTVHLMVGNHDDTPSLLKTFPSLVRDENGFVQKVLETPSGRFLLLDTKAPKGHAGAYCELRRNWLKHQLETADPIILLMHLSIKLWHSFTGLRQEQAGRGRCPFWKCHLPD